MERKHGEREHHHPRNQLFDYGASILILRNNYIYIDAIWSIIGFSN